MPKWATSELNMTLTNAKSASWPDIPHLKETHIRQWVEDQQAQVKDLSSSKSKAEGNGTLPDFDDNKPLIFGTLVFEQHYEQQETLTSPDNQACIPRSLQLMYNPRP